MIVFVQYDQHSHQNQNTNENHDNGGHDIEEVLLDQEVDSLLAFLLILDCVAINSQSITIVVDKLDLKFEVLTVDVIKYLL